MQTIVIDGIVIWMIVVNGGVGIRKYLNGMMHLMKPGQSEASGQKADQKN